MHSSYSGPTVFDTPICIPIKNGGSKWKDNELRFCLRSIAKFWTGSEIPKIHLLATSDLHWLNKESVILHHCATYSDAVREAIKLSPGYFWWNDDILLLKPTTIEDLLISRYVGTEMIPNSGYVGNSWKRKLSEVRDKLHTMGYSPIFNFSSHTPYVFNSKLMEYVILKFGLENKTPLETAYFNIARDWHPRKACDDKLTLNNGKKIPEDLSNYRFLNLFDKGLTQEVKYWLAETFPEKSPYEL